MYVNCIVKEFNIVIKVLMNLNVFNFSIWIDICKWNIV